MFISYGDYSTLLIDVAELRLKAKLLTGIIDTLSQKDGVALLEAILAVTAAARELGKIGPLTRGQETESDRARAQNSRATKKPIDDARAVAIQSTIDRAIMEFGRPLSRGEFKRFYGEFFCRIWNAEYLAEPPGQTTVRNAFKATVWNSDND